jgi:murein DD-endopeptidase MepM/ murein hydrolase activator NlpD
LLNATVGVQRVIARLRAGDDDRQSAAMTLQRRSLAIARSIRAAAPRPSAAPAPRSAAHRGSRRSGAHPLNPAAHAARTSERSGPRRERLVSITAVGLVGLAVALSSYQAAPTGPTGNTSGGGSEPRIAVGGAVAAELGGRDEDLVGAEGNVGSDPEAASDGPALSADGLAAIDGPFSADGTLVKPGSVDTQVADGAELMRTYRVRSGDTLTGIASKFHVSMMTVWWANDLKNKDDLHIGQTLTIPPVDGVVVTVGAADTLESLATKYHVDAAEIMEVNELDDPNLIVGQTLTMPGARSKPIATPKPKPTTKPSAPTRSGGSSGSTRPPSRYTGGKFGWPVAGGYISQYFHYGHYAIDIAADQGTRVMAAAGGVVTFAGWKNNGGGYQVWIAHGSGLFTTYNHMSSIAVGRGQHVSRGQAVGRVGMTGNATGPHLHFEVWRGPIWDGGTRVNPLSYL